MKILGGGTSKDGASMYSYMSHITVFIVTITSDPQSHVLHSILQTKVYN